MPYHQPAADKKAAPSSNVPYNPGNVLLIQPGITAVILDLSITRQALHNQFDKLLSPKNTKLSDDKEFTQLLTPFEKILQEGLVDLRNQNIASSYIAPILEKLAVIRSLLESANKCADPLTFATICSSLLAPASELEKLEKVLLFKHYKWSGSDVSQMEDALTNEGIHEIEETSSFARSIDLQVEAILSGTGLSVNRESTSRSLTEDEIEVRQAYSSIVNHRLGNLPRISAQIYTYCVPDAFIDCASDRANLMNVVDVIVNHYRYLELFLTFAEHAKFGVIVEWAQHRLPLLSNR